MIFMELKTVLKINTALFSVIGLLHLARLIWQWDASLGSWDVPLWFSGVFIVLAAGLAWMNWKQK